MKDTGGKFLIEHYSRLFLENPEVQGFTWTQYTPYFNDGDSCEFSSNHDYGSILIEDADGDLVDQDSFSDTQYTKYKGINEKFVEAFPELSDDDMEALFGNHVKVTVYPDKVDVEEYEHD